jgi:hypothetical protein
LVHGGRDRAATTLDEFGKQVGRHHGELRQPALLFCRVQHRGELTVADVDAREIGMGAKDAQCLLIALPLIVMPLDERADPERSTERVQAGLEAAQLFRMFVRRQPAGEECGLPAAG